MGVDFWSCEMRFEISHSKSELWEVCDLRFQNTFTMIHGCSQHISHKGVGEQGREAGGDQAACHWIHADHIAPHSQDAGWTSQVADQCPTPTHQGMTCSVLVVTSFRMWCTLCAQGAAEHVWLHGAQQNWAPYNNTLSSMCAPQQHGIYVVDGFSVWIFGWHLGGAFDGNLCRGV